MKLHTTFTVIVLCLLAFMYCVSCTILAPPSKAREQPGETQVERLFQYFGRLRTLPLAGLQREYTQQASAFAHSHSDEDRLRLVLLLSLPATGFENHHRALELLQEYLQDTTPTPTPFREIAVFFLTFLPSKASMPMYEPLTRELQEELRHKESQLLAQQQFSKSMRDELESQKSLILQLNKKLRESLMERERQSAVQQQLSKKLQDEKKMVKQLQEQIEKIKDIEKSLIEREQKGHKGT